MSLVKKYRHGSHPVAVTPAWTITRLSERANALLPTFLSRKAGQQQGAGLQLLLQPQLQPPQLHPPQLQPPQLHPQPHPQPPVLPPQLLFPQQHQTMISRMMIQQQLPPPKPLLHMMKPPERCRPNRSGLSSSYALRPGW